MQKSILILSGGLDSTVSAWIAREKTKPVLALTFDYGQRSANKEIHSAQQTATTLGVPHRVIPLPWLGEITLNAMVDQKINFPSLSEAELDNTMLTRESAQAVWVPNRNGVFLNVAAAFAESLGADLLITGFNAEEGMTFPDNSIPFVRAADEFFWYSTLRRVKVTSYTLGMSKTEIVKKGRELGVDLHQVWSCYEGGDSPCRRCESCLRSIRAFREAGVQ